MYIMYYIYIKFYGEEYKDQQVAKFYKWMYEYIYIQIEIEIYKV